MRSRIKVQTPHYYTRFVKEPDKWLLPLGRRIIATDPRALLMRPTEGMMPLLNRKSGSAEPVSGFRSGNGIGFRRPVAVRPAGQNEDNETTSRHGAVRHHGSFPAVPVVAQAARLPRDSHGAPPRVRANDGKP